MIDTICKLAKKGMRPSEIGVNLRDQSGIPQVRSITGSKVLRLLKAQGLAPELPEDLYYLIKKAVAMRKHLDRFRQDKSSKFHLILIESRVHRLARYYKVCVVLLWCALFVVVVVVCVCVCARAVRAAVLLLGWWRVFCEGGACCAVWAARRRRGRPSRSRAHMTRTHTKPHHPPPPQKNKNNKTRSACASCRRRGSTSRRRLRRSCRKAAARSRPAGGRAVADGGAFSI